MQLIGFIEGAEVYSAEHAIVPREHGGDLETEIAKTVRKYAKDCGEKPVIVLSGDQVRRLGAQLTQKAHEAAAAEEPAPEPAPADEMPESDELVADAEQA